MSVSSPHGFTSSKTEDFAGAIDGGRRSESIGEVGSGGLAAALPSCEGV
jgi:hypothetical protein